MRWKKLFTPVESLEPDEARSFMESRREGDYTLVDVRQPSEYEESHLPGAKLIPVARLADRLDEIDPAKPVIVYCAVGGRSRAAAQLLAGKGFGDVYNLKGGIKAWEGRKSLIPVDLGDLALTGSETVPEILILIYGMESGLENFYRQAAGLVPDAEVKDLLEKLAGIETKHKDRLHDLFSSMNPDQEAETRFQKAAASVLMEGGFQMDSFLEQNRKIMETPSGVLDLAMMLETHGLDLYLRYALDLGPKQGQEILYQLAEEEKAHLRALGEMLERVRTQSPIPGP
jgi:rhodanese-related sulfurtransferase/rubrerythrin